MNINNKVLFVLIFSILIISQVHAQFPDTDPEAWTSVFEDDFNYPSWTDFREKNKTGPNKRTIKWYTNIWGSEGIDPFNKNIPLNCEYAMSLDDAGSNMSFTPKPNSDPCGCDFSTLIAKKEIKDIDIPASGSNQAYTKRLFYSVAWFWTHPYDTDPITGKILGVFKYGYYEIKMRLRDYNTIYMDYGYADGQWRNFRNTTINGGTHAQFWMHNGTNDVVNGYKMNWSELDINEGMDSYNTQTCNMITQWTNVSTGERWPDNQDNPEPKGNAVQNAIIDDKHRPGATEGGNKPIEYDGKFHIIGMEWTARYVKYYVDHQLVRYIPNFEAAQPKSLIPMTLHLNIDIANVHPFHQDAVTGHTKFPYKFDVDYIKIWKLNMSKCREQLVITNTPGFELYDHKVRRNITVYGASPGLKVRMLGNTTTPNRATLRAVQSITIKKNFFVPKNASFSAVTTGLYE